MINELLGKKIIGNTYGIHGKREGTMFKFDDGSVKFSGVITNIVDEFTIIVKLDDLKMFDYNEYHELEIHTFSNDELDDIFKKSSFKMYGEPTYINMEALFSNDLPVIRIYGYLKGEKVEMGGGIIELKEEDNDSL